MGRVGLSSSRKCLIVAICFEPKCNRPETGNKREHSYEATPAPTLLVLSNGGKSNLIFYSTLIQTGVLALEIHSTP